MPASILVPLDGSPLADAAIPRAAEIARRTGGALHLVRVHRPIVPLIAPEQMMFSSDSSLDTQLAESARAWLFKRAGDLRAALGIPVTAEFRVGWPVDEVSAAARSRDATAIVCTTHGTGGWSLRWIGSVADGLIRQAGCPVLAMSEAALSRPDSVGRLLVLLDGSELSSEILPAARWAAHAFGASIDLFRVVEAPWFGDGPLGVEVFYEDQFGIDEAAREAKQHLAATADGLREEGFVVGTVVKVSHDTGRAILDHINETNPDMVALSTHGRGLSRLLMGSVANKVLRSGGRPMLCLRSKFWPAGAGANAPTHHPTRVVL